MNKIWLRLILVIINSKALGGFMKKKLLLILMVCIPFISIILVILFRATAEPTNEEIIKSSLDLSDKMIRANYFKKVN